MAVHNIPPDVKNVRREPTMSGRVCQSGSRADEATLGGSLIRCDLQLASFVSHDSQLCSFAKSPGTLPTGRPANPTKEKGGRPRPKAKSAAERLRGCHPNNRMTMRRGRVMAGNRRRAMRDPLAPCTQVREGTHALKVSMSCSGPRAALLFCQGARTDQARDSGD